MRSILAIIVFLCSSPLFAQNATSIPQIISHQVDLSTDSLVLFWQDSSSTNFSSFERLKAHVDAQNSTLLFAMNGGMYLIDGSPQGLYIENGVKKSNLDTTTNTYGNFYLQPNGVFYFKKNKAFVSTTRDFISDSSILYATQSGPMLVIEGQLHSKFNKGSKNVHIRNGVGILPNGKIIFAISKKKINFYDFATFFQNKGCDNALYLDGFVSKMYLPEKNRLQTNGNFGVIIGQIKH